jgi:hypothetical protein
MKTTVTIQVGQLPVQASQDDCGYWLAEFGGIQVKEAIFDQLVKQVVAYAAGVTEVCHES